MDIVGPLPVSRGYKYILTCIDRTTRWPEAYPLQNITSEEIVKTFIQNYISRFGIPLNITVDRGSQFTSSLFSNLVDILGIEKIHTSAYHPQANGIIERFLRQLKTSLTSSNDSLHWSDELPIILLALRNQVKEDLKCCSAKMVYGQTLRIPGELIVPSQNLENTNEFLLQKLREHFSSIRTVISHHGNSRSYIPPSLMNWTIYIVGCNRSLKPAFIDELKLNEELHNTKQQQKKQCYKYDTFRDLR
ncbi:protein NYNRIN-like [Lucilia sericata]|uniref:protein NYNRIN-like n=1 Tax=Lucilia sericata TaxID=13632 RepID=UPI0018A7F265|nr:protein NYNRIN-like [Lucilia sericata]